MQPEHARIWRSRGGGLVACLEQGGSGLGSQVHRGSGLLEHGRGSHRYGVASRCIPQRRALFTRSCGGRGVFGVSAPLENMGESGAKPCWKLRLNASPMYCSVGSTAGWRYFRED